jgi:succinate dehydrogenase/fumarate reductase flavoprotein subunit
MASTAGSFSNGDGITLATALGAKATDLDKVQIHPTGWVDPRDPTNPSKVLAAELMRGIGGILINSKGERCVYRGVIVALSDSEALSRRHVPFMQL